jgi:hypothetical protein
MHPLARRIALLVSVFSLIIGFFLLAYNLLLITEEAKTIALNLWPVLLVIAGFMLVADSAKKRVFAGAASITTDQFPLAVDQSSTEVAFRVQFSYGRLLASWSPDAPRLVTEQRGPAAAPAITHEVVGDRQEVSIAMSQPMFPSNVQLKNTWRLDLPSGLPLRLFLHLHEADLLMDLRRLDVESLDLRTESGTQELLLGRPQRKLTGQIYASGSSLSVVLPARVFVRVRLLNPFCRVDYPQGDLEKRQDGSLVTPSTPDSRGSVEIDVDGPLRKLKLDIEDAAET